MKMKPLILTAVILVALLVMIVIFSYKNGLYSTEYLLQNWVPPTQPNVEEMEIYKYLRANISDETSLNEMLNTFEEMCQIPHETVTNIYRFEAHTYEQDGEPLFYITISHQFEVPGYYEMLDVGLDVCFTLDEDVIGFDTVVLMEDDWQEFIEKIRTSEVYQVLLGKEIIEYYIFGISW